ncbi:MAG TPA: LD-carboxypeptidase [Alphaproteobacteria bacterium]|nr:LD-carboxypeptidase [Alphaproteobacteria bacterium]
MKLSPLRPDDCIAVVAPADWLDPAVLEQGAARLAALGYRAKIHPQNFLRQGRMAGSDGARRQALHDAFVDPEVRAILCARGGYGAGRLVDGLDYGAIRANPKPFVGYSDITALLNAIHKHTGLPTFHGPVLKELALGDSPVGEGILLDLLGGRQPKGAMDRLLADATVLRPGMSQGRLAGGNLTLIHALIGTRHDVVTAGRILFLEDWREPLYHLDRMLFHLRQVGKFDGIAGLIVGRIAEIDERPEHLGGTIDDLLADHFGAAPFPVATNAAIGHARDKITLPLGARAEMRCENGRLTLDVQSVFAPG